MRALSILALLLTAASVQAQPVRVPGTRVTLEPPAGYRPADGFAGFQNDALEAALMVVEIPGAAFAETVAGMTPEGFRAQGIRDAVRRDVTVNGAPALFVAGTQAQGGVVFSKWVLVTGDDAGTIIVNATVPRRSARSAGPALERAALSLTWGEGRPADLFEGLGFTLTIPDGLPDRTSLGGVLALADGMGPDRGTAPIYIAGRGTGRLAANLAAAAAEQIRQVAGITDVGPAESRAITVDGRRAVEAVAQATHAASRAPVTVYVALVPDGAAYTAFQGIVGTDLAEDWVPRFRAVTESVRWVRR